MKQLVKFRVPRGKYQEAVAFVEAVNSELEGHAVTTALEIAVEVEERQVNGVISSARENNFPLIYGPHAVEKAA